MSVCNIILGIIIEIIETDLFTSFESKDLYDSNKTNNDLDEII